MLTSVTSAGSKSSLASFVHTNPQLAADLTRLVSPKAPPIFDGRGQRTISRPNSSDLKQISASIAQSGEDAQAVISLFSDVKIAAEILISSIRSPNDMYEGEVLFELKDNLHCSPLASKLLPLVRTYFKDVYPLSDRFEDILRATLFGEGSFPILVLPENSLSDIIAGKNQISTETYTAFMSTDGYPAGLGYLGPAKKDADGPKTALERFSSLRSRAPNPGNRCLEVTHGQHKITCENIVILDNPLQLQMPLIASMERHATVRSQRGSVFNGEAPMTDRDIATTLYRKTTHRRQDFVKIKSSNEIKRYSVGRPLVLELPPESVVPVINRGRPKDPIGYIVILDGDGTPLSRMTEVTQFEALKKQSLSARNSNASYGDMSSYLLQKTASAFGMQNCEEVTLRQVNKIFGEILEADLSARLRNGIWSSEVSVSNSHRLSELMLYRVLSNQQTQILFVPEEMLTYFNYQVNENGTGRNLLQDTLVISSMRAQVLFARVMGAVKNSIGRTKVNVEIDPDETDAQGLFNTIQTEVLAARQTLTTPNSVNPTDVLNQIQAAGIEFEVTGAKGLPETKIQFSETNSNYSRPDDELSSELADLMINAIGVPPEMVEEARRAEFATVAIANNVLFSKRVRHMQQRYDPQNTHLVISMLMADNTFIIELKKVILENLNLVINRNELHQDISAIKDNKPALVDLLCSEFISNLQATLARPDLKSVESNLEALAKHEEMIDKALENIFSLEAVDAMTIGEQAAEKIEALRKGAKAALVRRFMLDNGMAPEAFDLVTLDEDGILSWDLRAEVEQHAGAVAKVLANMTERTSRIAAASDAEQSKLIPTDPGAVEAPDTGSSTSNDDAGGGGEDDFGLGGFDDLGITS